MKILHFADAHLGRDDSGPIVPETGLSTRLTDFTRSLDRIMEYVETEGVDLILFCGDAYTSPNPNSTPQREFAYRLQRMAQIAPVVWDIGNHDLPGAAARAHAGSIFRTLAVRDVYVIDRPQLLPLSTNSGDLEIVAIPFPTRHNLMATDKVQGLPKEQVNKLIADTLAETILRLARDLSPETPSILMAHLSVIGGAFGSEQAVMLGRDVAIPLEALALPQFDYVALGHLHRHQQLCDNPPVVYSGSIERLDFGEEKEEKGFVVVTLGKGQKDDLFSDGAYTEVEFVPLPVRKFQTIEVHLDSTDPTDAVMESIHEAGELEGAVVRLIIEGTSQAAGLLDEGPIHRALEGTLRSTVIKQIDRDTRTRLDGLRYEEMRPLDLLEAWFGSNGKTPEQREALMKAAEELMKEVGESASLLV